jgi:hypothetical protein
LIVCGHHLDIESPSILVVKECTIRVRRNSDEYTRVDLHTASVATRRRTPLHMLHLDE